MKKLISLFGILIVVLVFGSISNAANSRSSGNTYEFAEVDTAPGASGYYTNSVNLCDKKRVSRHDSVWFVISGTGSMTVTLQFKLVGQTTWTDYDTYTSVEYKVLDAGACGGEAWRAIVKSGAYSSGSMEFGFTW